MRMAEKALVGHHRRAETIRATHARTLAVVFCMATANNMIRPMASYRAVELEADYAQLGMIAASYAVLSIFVAVPIGRWIDRWGARRFALLGATMMAATAYLMARADGLFALGAFHAVVGLGQISLAVAMQTSVANRGDISRRDARFGSLAVAISLGQITGPALAGTLVTNSGGRLAPAFLGAGGVMLLAILLVGTTWPVPTRRPEEGRTDAAAAATPQSERMLPAAGRVLGMPAMPQALLASLAALASIDILIAYLPVYGEERGLSVATVSLLLSTRAAAGMISRLVMVLLTRRFGRQKVLLACLAVPAVLVVIAPSLTSLPLMFVVIALVGFGLGICQPLTMAWVAAQAPSDLRGTALGVRMSGNRLGQLAVPTAVGVIGAGAGFAAIFVATGLMLGASSYAVARTRFVAD